MSIDKNNYIYDDPNSKPAYQQVTETIMRYYNKYIFCKTVHYPHTMKRKGKKYYTVLNNKPL